MTNSPTDAFVTKYDANGNRLVTMAYGSDGNEWGFAAVGDAKGNLYVTGQTSGDMHGNVGAGSHDLFLMKLNTLDAPPRPDLIFSGSFELVSQ